jgi:uncharacterized protein
LERKTLPLTETKVDSSAAGSFTGYASLWGILDSQGDVVLKGAYSDTLAQFLERGFISWGHDWAEPVATIREAYEDDKGLYLAADFHSDDFSQRARTRTVERIQRGKFMGLSIGYQTVDAEFTDTARLLKKLDLFETGLVTVPALREAGVSEAKGDEPVDESKPMPGEHACRVNSPDKYDRFRRQNGAREHDGKKYDVIYGHRKDGGAWEVQALRYPTSAGWTADAARAHCNSHDGASFEPASDGNAACGCADADPLTTSLTLLGGLLDAADTKAGRVLAERNWQRIQQAHGLLQAVMDDATGEPAATNDGKGRALWLAFQRISARQLGVPV